MDIKIATVQFWKTIVGSVKYVICLVTVALLCFSTTFIWRDGFSALPAASLQYVVYFCQARTDSAIFLLRFRPLHLVPCSGFIIHWTFLPSTHLAPDVDRLKPSPSETYVALLLMPPLFWPSDGSNRHIRSGGNSIHKCLFFWPRGIFFSYILLYKKPPNLGAHCLGKPRSSQK
jgi:hypothetical protein